MRPDRGIYGIYPELPSKNAEGLVLDNDSQGTMNAVEKKKSRFPLEFLFFSSLEKDCLVMGNQRIDNFFDIAVHETWKIVDRVVDPVI